MPRMASQTPSPLSPTVNSVFSQFLKRLSDEKVLGKAALDALAENLYGQKLDADKLRAAIFKSDESPK
jgi:hypothetical protein